MNWSSPRPSIPAAAPSKKSAQLEKILASSKSLLAAGKFDEAIAELNRKGGAILREPTGQMMLGSIFSLSGRPDKALAAFDAAARLAPKSAAAHFNRGFALKQLGRTAEAVTAYEAALRIDPDMVEARHNLAVALNELKCYGEALVAADAAIALRPAAAEGHYNRGVVLAGLERHEEALAAFDVALKFRPVYPDARIARGASLRALGRLDEAIAAIAEASAQAPQRADVHIAHALVLKEAKRFDEALASLDEALQVSPGNFEALFARAGVLDTAGSRGEALAIYDELHARDSQTALVQVNRGNLLRNLRRYEEALAAFDDVLSRAPDMVSVQLNRANTLVDLDRFEDALSVYDILFAAQKAGITDSFLAAENTLGNFDWETFAVRASALSHLHRFDEALDSYDRALVEKPDAVTVHADRSLLLLLLGRMEEGWPEYGYRGLKPDEAAYRPEHPAPLWTGEPLAGKRLLVTGEQGLGDIVQFIRYLPPLVAEAASVDLAVPPRLHRLLGGALADVRLAEKADPAEAFDYQIRLLSIPGLRGTSLATIPADTPYLHAEAERVAAWRDRLPKDGFNIGIHWQGNKDYGGDRRRSFPLAEFAPLAAIPGVRLVSLQKGEGLDQLAQLPAGTSVHSLGEDFDSGSDAFVDSAAVMQSLDLVVSSDSAIVHVAGSLGRPVWVALPYTPDWRWLLGREDSPWYPSARLFRQPRLGDWGAVFARIAAEVTALVRAKQS